MKKILLSIALVLGVPAMLFADRIPADKALRIAREFVRSSVPSSMMKQACIREIPVLASQTDGHYVFNVGRGNGYVVVAGDDMVKDAVLGYADSGTFAEGDMPENLRWWLAEYDRQIAYMQQHKAEFENSATATDGAAATNKYKEILPLVKAKWNQDYPYNMKCPVVNGKQCPTGCVATALAQIMYYNKWPETGIGTYGGTDYAALHFDWDNMVDDYSKGSTPESREAVSTLMAALGNAMDMCYDQGASGTTNEEAYNGIVRNFGYTKALVVARESMEPAWDKYIYYELSQNRPVYYSGATAQFEGHAFVCDGFRDGFLHINWGWGGVAEGYFRSSAMNPPVQGIGGSKGDGFNFYQEIITNLYNPNDETQKFMIGVTDNDLELDKLEATADDALAVSGSISVMTDESAYSLGLRITDESGNETFIKESNRRDPEGGVDESFSVSLKDFPMADGTYRVAPAVYGADSKTWNDVMALKYSVTTSYTATVADGKITFTPGAAGRIEVSDMEVPELMYPGEKATVKAKIKCVSGQDFNKKLYIGFLKGDEPLLFQQENDAVSMFEGMTTEVSLDVTVPKEKGEYKIALFTIAGGREVQLTDYQATNIVERGAVLIVSSPLTIADNNYYNVDPDNFTVKAKVRCTVKNFNDELRLVVFDMETREEVCHISAVSAIDLNLTKTLTITGKLTGTKPGHMYYGRIHKKDDLGRWKEVKSNKASTKLANNVTFRTADPSSIQNVQSDAAEGDGMLYSADGRCVGRVGEAGSLPEGLYLVKKAGKWVKVRK